MKKSLKKFNYFFNPYLLSVIVVILFFTFCFSLSISYGWTAPNGNPPAGSNNQSLFFSNGKIGIGTSTPAYPLSASGTIYSSTGFRFPDGTTQTTAFSGVSQTITSGNVSSGAFGSNTGGGNYSFPASLSVSTTTAPTGGAAFFNGNVGIGTAAPDSKLHVSGAIESSSAAANHYYNVFSYYGGVASQMGTLKITLPKYGSNTMLHIVIKGYDYTVSTGAWEAVIGGYNYSSHTWIYTSAQINGKAPFDQVRLGNDGTNDVILLGTTATVWAYSKIEVSDVIATHSGMTGWGTGWSASVIASETGLLNIVTPTIPTYLDTTGYFGIATTTPAYPLSVAGTIFSSTGGFRFPDGTTQTTAAGTGSQWTTSSTAIYYSGGNVGIGTASPAQALTIGNSSSIGNYIQVNGSPTDNTYDGFVIARKYPRFTLQDTYAGGSTFNFWNLGNTIRFGTNTGTVGTSAWYTKAGDAGDVVFNGRVSVATTTTSYPLEVNGAGDFNNNQVHGIATPTATTDAANKSYVDSVVGGGSGSGSFTTLSVSGTSTLATTSGNVGIGTASPRAKLDIFGSVSGGKVESLVLSNSGATDNSATAIYMGYQSSGLGVFGARILQVGNPSATRSSDLLFQIHGTPADNADSSWVTPLMIQRTTGNVGVATTTPAYPLTVAGTIYSSTGGFRFPDNTTQTTAYAGGTQTITSGNVSSGAFGSNTGGGNYSFPASVGIGTASPSEQLHILNSTNYKGIRLDRNASTTHTDFSYYTGATRNWFIRNSGANSNLEIDEDNGGGAVNRMTFEAGGNIGVGNSNPTYGFDVSGTFRATATSTFSGNVGIGTTSPSQKLSVAGSASLTGNIYMTATAPAIFMDDAGNDGYGIKRITTNDGAGNWNFRGGGYYSSGLLYDTTGNGYTSMEMNFEGANGYIALNVAATGTAGSAITAKTVTLNTSGLTLASGLQILTNTADSASAPSYSWNGDANMGIFHPATDTLGFSTAGSEIMRISSAGNVGIATTTPSYDLTVNGTGYFASPVVVGTPTATNHATTKSYVDSAVTNVATQWTTSSTDIYYNSGNIGIGTTNPGSYKLNVAGSIYSTSLYVNTPGGQWLTGKTGTSGINAATQQSVSQYHPMLRQTTSSGHVVNLGGLGDKFGFYGYDVNRVTNGVDYYMTMDLSNGNINTSNNLFAAGNIGVATTTAGYTLTVNGTGYFASPVVVGTPTQASHATTKSYVDSAILGGSASSSASCAADATCEMNNANLQGGNITGVSKLTVTTIDPLYNIGGKKYSTYAASIAGGVKEEFVGKGKLEIATSDKRQATSYEYIINFDTIENGSDLWVWRKAVDFSKDNIDAFITPYGTTAQIYYVVDGNKIIFRGDKQTEFSYRLIGKRFDWADWPTFAKDQNENAGFNIR